MHNTYFDFFIAQAINLPPHHLLNNTVTHILAGRQYEQEAATGMSRMPFPSWLRSKCEAMENAAGVIGEELMALSWPPCKKACSFKSMTSFGSHYRVDLEEAGAQHVTFDSGVAELDARATSADCLDNGSVVQLVRVGILKDILVLNYGHLNIVLMVVSWVAKDTADQPRLRRDPYGFWLANMAALPRDTTEPYLLPILASQVQPLCNVYVIL